MPSEYPKVKVIAATGVRPADAIKAALGESYQAFASRHGFWRPSVSTCVHGRQRLDRVRVALAEALDVEKEWLDKLLDGAAEPKRKAG